MNKFPCPTGIDCECTNYPVSNISAEGPDRAPGVPSDRPTFVCNWQHFRPPPLSPGPADPMWCFRIADSFVSNTAACVDARYQAILCLPPFQLVGNDEITVTVACSPS